MLEMPIIKKVEEATKRLSRYHLKLELSPGAIVYEGEVDESNQSLHFSISSVKDKLYIVDFLRVGDAAYGKRGTSEQQKIRVEGRFPQYLQSALEIIKNGRITSTTEVGQFWKVEVNVENIPFRDNPERFYHSIFGESREPKAEVLKRIVEASRNLKVYMNVWISKEDCQIKKITVQSLTPKLKSEMILTFSPSQAEIPALPAEKMKAIEKEVPLNMLFFRLPSIGGWSEPTHRLFAQRSIDLVRQKDTDGKYAEIYDKIWGTTDAGIMPLEEHHPIIIGAHYEDAEAMPDFYERWFAPNPGHYFRKKYIRDFNHFGYGEQGLKYEDYFDYREGTERPLDGRERYFSAHDWGYGGSKVEHINRLTFTEAIKQYNMYTFESKRNAYLMLGHVLHLLQDQAEPDHANLLPHGASGMTEPEAYSKFKVCEIVCIGSLIFWPVCTNMCNWAIDDDEIGYERLVKDHWSLDRIEENIKKTGILTQTDYNSYFEKMGTESQKILNESACELKYPVGLKNILLGIYNVAVDPEIDYPEEAEDYLKLTDSVAVQAICLSAGLIRHFYEIVNHPPYVERVVVVKSVPGLTPSKFAKFNESLYMKDCSKVQVVYDARWETKDSTERKMVVDKKLSLSPDHEAYIFIIFGPSIGPAKNKVMREDPLIINLVGRSPNNDFINIPINLKLVLDSETGYYYMGSFKPYNPWQKKYSLTIEIQAHDASAHFSTRLQSGVPAGDEIDSNPATIALVNPDNPPLYPFIDYEPGVDRNHGVEIDLPILQDQYEYNDTFEKATRLEIDKFHNLTLHKADDVDFFLIEYQEGGWGFGGDYIKWSQPQLEISIGEEFGGCLSLSIYKSNRSRYKEFGITNKVVIGNPTSIFDDEKLFVEVKNPDFVLQGPLRYKLKVTYVPARGQFIRLNYLIDPRKLRPIPVISEDISSDLDKLAKDLDSLLRYLGEGYKPQYYPGNTSVAKNRRKHMANDLEKMRDISDEDLTAILGHRAPGSDYPSTHPPLSEIGEPDCPIREIVEPTPGAAAGDRVRYVQWADSMYNAPATPYFRSYHAAINFRGVDPGTLSGRQVVEMRERDLEGYAKRQAETEMTDWGLSGMRGCTVHGHSLRLQEDGIMFDMLDRRRLEGGVIIMDKEQVGIPIDRKVNLGKPMSEAEAAKRTTIYRLDNVPFRSDKELIEHVQRVWELRTKYGFQPKV